MQFRKGRIDPLELLRDSIMQKKSIKLRNKNSEFKLLFENNIELKCTSVIIFIIFIGNSMEIQIQSRIQFGRIMVVLRMLIKEYRQQGVP